MENDKTEAGAVTPVYKDTAKQDNLMQPDPVVPQHSGFDHAPTTNEDFDFDVTWDVTTKWGGGGLIVCACDHITCYERG